MAGYSSRKDQLWYFALQLADEEAKFFQIAQQEEEHGQRIQIKYNQLVSNLSCLGDIVAMMYEEEKLTLKELELIQHLQSTPIRANEELLSIIARKPRDVYECFLSLIKNTNQLHLYQMLISGDGACDGVNRGNASDHKDLICRNFMWLSEDLDTESGLISLLYQQNVFTVREKERMLCVNGTVQKNELLLGLLSKKSPTDFEKFLEALGESGQGHLIKRLRKPADATADRVKEPTALQTRNSVSKELLPKAPHKSGQKPIATITVESSSEKVLSPKTLPNFGQKLIHLNSLLKPIPPPKPDNQSTAVQRDAKSIHIVAKTTEKTVRFRRTVGVKVQGRLNELECQLQTEIASKVTSVGLFNLDKQDDSLKMWFHILLKECCRMRKETEAKKVENNVELERLRENMSQYSAAASMNEVFRTQLHSTQHELINERFQSNKDRVHLVEEIEKLKTNIHNEKAKCKRLNEEKLLSNTVIMKLEERLTNSEYDKQILKQQMNEMYVCLANCENELHMSKDSFEECKSEMISLRAERDELKEVCEKLSKENNNINELQIQLHQVQELNSDLLDKLNATERRLEVADEERFDLFKSLKCTVEEKSLESDQILKLQKELDTEKHNRKEFEDELTNATAQLEELNRKSECINITSVSRESHVITNNLQFMIENIRSNRLIDLLHEENCITDEERDYLLDQPNNFYKNDALLHWMRTIAFEQDRPIGLKVLECFRQSEQNFVVELLSKGGVLVKSKISTNLVKERQSFSLFAKSSSDLEESLKEKEAMVIDNLNQGKGLPLSSSQSVSSKIADGEIIIAPYCRHEDDGIVIWFWCQTKNAQRSLRRMYSSDILLGRLLTVFKEFSNGSVSSESELHVHVLIPTCITIYTGDLTRNEKVVDFKTDPRLLLTIRRNTKEKTNEGIYGLAVLADEIFATIKKNSEVQVYQRTSLQFQRGFTVEDLKEPRDIVSCSKNNCLYIIDGKPFGQPMEILRVDINGNILKKIWQGNDWGRLSVTSESNLILAVLDKNKLLEITPDGQLVRDIKLTIPNPWHAVKLNNDRFVVVYDRCSGGGICMINGKGKVLMSPSHRVFDSAVFLPINVAVNRDGSLFVVDEDGGRILLLTSTLKYQREIVSKRCKKHGLVRPRRLFLDEHNARLLVFDDKLSGGRILVFDISG